MSDITINIYGGNIQIIPNATEAVQNFYGDQAADNAPEEQPADTETGQETDKLSIYIK